MQDCKIRHWSAATALIAALFGFSISNAEATPAEYDYVGSDFTQVCSTLPGCPYTTSENITGRAVFDPPLSTGTVNLLSYSFTAGPLTLNNTNSYLANGSGESDGSPCCGNYEMSVGSNGALEAWIFKAEGNISSNSNSFIDVTTLVQQDAGTTDDEVLYYDVISGLDYDYSAYNAAPGTWSMVTPPAAASVSPKNGGGVIVSGNAAPSGNPNDGLDTGCPCPVVAANPFVGEPINAATGNVYEAETDFVGAPNTHLSLTR